MFSKFIYVVACDSIFFIFKLDSRLCIYITFSHPFVCWRTLGLLVHLTCCGYCCYEHGRTNISLRFCFQFFWIFYAEVGLFDPMVIQFLSLWGTTILFSTVAESFYVRTNSSQVFQFFRIFFCIFGSSHCSGCEVDCLNCCTALYLGSWCTTKHFKIGITIWNGGEN